MKTAMQELIEAIDFKEQNHVDAKVLLVLSNLKSKALKLLEKEKKQIVKAHGDKCHSINQDQSRYVSGEMYYDQTFNENKLTINKELIIVDFDKVKKEWIEEAYGMTDLEKAKYYSKKINQNK